MGTDGAGWRATVGSQNLRTVSTTAREISRTILRSSSGDTREVQGVQADMGITRPPRFPKLGAGSMNWRRITPLHLIIWVVVGCLIWWLL